MGWEGAVRIGEENKCKRRVKRVGETETDSDRVTVMITENY
jgi:hypothetical protein